MKQSTLSFAKKEVISAIEKAAINLNMEIVESTENSISLFHNGGLLSFGNRIKLQLSLIKQNKTKITVTSNSAAQLQIIDWGTNENLELNLISEIKESLK